MGAIILGIIESSESGWAAPVTIVSLAVGAVLLVALVINEKRAEQPIMPLRLFASRARSGAYGIRFLYLGAMMGFFFFITQFLQNVLGWNPLQAGLGFLPMTALNFAVALAVPRLNRRVPSIVLLVAGIALTLAGMFWLSLVDATSAYLTAIAAPMILIGIGQGLTFAPLTSYGIADVVARDAGAASGLLNTTHQLGSSVGLAILVALGASVDGGTASVANIVTRVDIALTGSSVLLALALAVAVVVVRPRRPVAMS